MTTPDPTRKPGARRGARAKRRLDPRVALYALAMLVLVAAWAWLVYAAIGFGSSARNGESRSWAYLALAVAGAIACLFSGLMVGARILRRLGVTRAAEPTIRSEVRVPGGRRAAR